MKVYCKLLKIYIWKKNGASTTGEKVLPVYFNGYKYDISIDFDSNTLGTYDPSTNTTNGAPQVVTISITRSFNTPMITWKDKGFAKEYILPPQRFQKEAWMDDLVIMTEVVDAEGAEPDTGTTLPTL